MAIYYAYQYLSRPSVRPLLALTVVSVLGLYTHYTFGLVFAWSTVLLLWRAMENRRAVVIHAVAVIALFLPWALYSLVPIVQNWQTSLGVQQNPSVVASLLFPIHVLIPPLFKQPTWFTLVQTGAGLVVGLAWLQVLRLIVKRQSIGMTIPLAWLLSFIVSGLLALSLVGFTDVKYATVLAPALITVVAVGLAQMPIAASRVVLAACLFVGVVAANYMQAQTPVVNYRPATALVEREGRSGDVVLVHPFNDDIVVRNYYRGPLPVYGFLPDRPPGEATLEDNVRRNFRVQVDVTNVSQLSEYVKDASRVWFFYDVTIEPGYWNGHLIDAWFADQGYRQTVYRDIFKDVPPLLIRYDAT